MNLGDSLRAFDDGVLTLGTTTSEMSTFERIEPEMQGTFTAGSETFQFVRDATGRVTSVI